MLRKTEFADLHLHSNFSDGQYSPKELINKSQLIGLQAIAIVDHDDINAIPEALKYGEEKGIEIITGVELSVCYQNCDLHILAYCFDYQNTELVKYLNFFKKERVKRAQKIVQILNKLDISISFDEVVKKAGHGSIGRPHIAELLVSRGYVYSFQDAFNKFLGDGKPANVDKFKMDLTSALELIKSAGGVCSIAHPGMNLKDEDLLLLIKSGVNGIEVVHPKHKEGQKRKYCEMAKIYGLFVTGGSDFHGERNGEAVLGKFNIPYKFVRDMKKLANNHNH